MKWGKTILYAVGGTLVGGLSQWLANPTQPFTFRTVGIPALASLGAVLTGLFTEKPTAPPSN